MKALLELANTMQAANLVSHNISYAKKKKKTVRGMIGLGVSNVAGTAFVKATGDVIATV